ncbi:MAG: PepSY domain-containing protein, partial [Chitinophagaceae bacterium]|nr:PepSY domain-containing protein [Chitinophagaceae bacterium]
MIRKNIYKWHRISSLIIAIPVLLWAISGFMHPLMTTIKPRIATQTLTTQAIDSTALQTTLRTALEQNNIKSIHTVRIIHIDTNWFYQVQLKNGEPPLYLSAKNGKSLRNGDKLYAQYIAKQFLQGQPKTGNQEHVMQASSSGQDSLHIDLAVMPIAPASHDCCDAATNCVLTDTTGSLVESVEPITSFNKEYKYVNRLLPVYKVKFDRADSIRVYVETTQDRFAFAMDNRRAGFDRFFAICHTWDWLSDTGIFKYVLMGAITLLGFLTTIMGLYIFFITKTKNGSQPIAKARRSHRYISLTASLFTLMFTFSGGLHALDKLRTPDLIADDRSNDIPTTAIHFDYQHLQGALPTTAFNDISLARIDSSLYWRVITQKKKVEYISNDDHAILPNG